MDFAKKHIYSLIFILCISLANAACENVNLYEENSILDSMKIVDQGEIASCYAQTAAQMSEYHLRESNDANPEVRGLWVALIHKLKRKVHWSPGRLDYSLLEWAIDDLKEIGNCQYSDYQKSMSSLKANSNITDDDAVYFLYKTYKKYRANTVALKKQALEKAFESVMADEYFRGRIPQSIWSSVEKMRGKLATGFLVYLKKSIFGACSNLNDVYPQIPEVVSTARGMESDQFVMSVINNVLSSSRPQPVGIGYCSKIFSKSPGSLAVAKKPRLVNMMVKVASCSAHYSVLVGQRNKAGTCEVLLRNSYGEGSWAVGRSCYCQAADGSRFECSSDAPGTGVKVLGCWVPAKELAQNIFDLSYFVK